MSTSQHSASASPPPSQPDHASKVLNAESSSSRVMYNTQNGSNSLLNAAHHLLNLHCGSPLVSGVRLPMSYILEYLV